jgi:uncharacterized caspase-like protein
VVVRATLLSGEVRVLVVGISDYEDRGIPPLRYAESDAEAVYRFFADDPKSPANKDNVRFLRGAEATATGLRSAIGEHLAQKASPNDMAIFYYAGHGDVGPDGQEYFMIPRDARKATLSETAIEVQDLQRLWDKIRAKRKIFIADACNAGGFVQGLRGGGVGGVPGFERGLGEGSVVLAASSPGQKAREDEGLKHGLYTYYLLRGLRGAADAGGDGRVTVRELANYLDREVERAARERGGEQRPAKKEAASGEIFLTR